VFTLTVEGITNVPEVPSHLTGEERRQALIKQEAHPEKVALQNAVTEAENKLKPGYRAAVECGKPGAPGQGDHWITR
jgi:hypothetical protein